MRCTARHIEEGAHEEGVWCAAWIPGAPSFLTGAVDERVKRWETASDTITSKEVYENAAGYTLGVISVDVDPTGEWAASSALDSYIRIWSLRDHQERVLLESMPTEVWSLAFSPSRSKCLIAAAGGTRGLVKLWDITSMQPGVKGTAPEPELYEVHGHGQATKASGQGERPFVLSVAFSPDGKSMACGCMDGTVCIFDVETNTVKSQCTGHFKPVRSLTFAPDSKQVLTACDDMQVHLYEAETGALLEAFSGHDSWVLGLDVHPSGQYFVSSSSDNTVKFWDIGQRTCVATLKDHKDQVWAVAFNDDGSEMVSCGDDGSVITYSVQ